MRRFLVIGLAMALIAGLAVLTISQAAADSEEATLRTLEFAIVGNRNFVRTFACRNLRDGFQRGGIDDGKRGVLLVQDEQRRGRRLRSREIREQRKDN